MFGFFRPVLRHDATFCLRDENSAIKKEEKKANFSSDAQIKY